MKNAFSRIGQTCASVLLAGGLAGSSLTAAMESRVTITVPHSVTIGSTVLPSGTYTITNVDIEGNDGYFVIRSASTPTMTLQAQKIVSADEQNKTSVIFSRDGDVWHFNKMFLKGEAEGYQFVNLK